MKETESKTTTKDGIFGYFSLVLQHVKRKWCMLNKKQNLYGKLEERSSLAVLSVNYKIDAILSNGCYFVLAKQNSYITSDGFCSQKQLLLTLCKTVTLYLLVELRQFLSEMDSFTKKYQTASLSPYFQNRNFKTSLS